MGTLFYGPRTYELDDRVLANLQVIVSMKLRRHESFFVSWKSPDGSEAGRQSIWLDNGIHLAFEYDSDIIPTMNGEWAEAFARSAQTGFGLQLTDEDGRPLNIDHADVPLTA
jgi:hypothetical protein